MIWFEWHATLTYPSAPITSILYTSTQRLFVVALSASDLKNDFWRAWFDITHILLMTSVGMTSLSLPPVLFAVYCFKHGCKQHCLDEGHNAPSLSSTYVMYYRCFLFWKDLSGFDFLIVQRLPSYTSSLFFFQPLHGRWLHTCQFALDTITKA